MKKKDSFSDSLNKLEEILGKLESGEESLESALDLYKKGTDIILKCTKELKTAEQKMVDVSSTISFNLLEKEQEPAFLNDAR